MGSAVQAFEAAAGGQFQRMPPDQLTRELERAARANHAHQLQNSELIKEVGVALLRITLALE